MFCRGLGLILYRKQTTRTPTQAIFFFLRKHPDVTAAPFEMAEAESTTADRNVRKVRNQDRRRFFLFGPMTTKATDRIPANAHKVAQRLKCPAVLFTLRYILRSNWYLIRCLKTVEDMGFWVHRGF